MIQTEPPAVELPEDVNTLQQMIMHLLADVDDLNKQLAWYKRYIFGRRSEQLDPSQLILFEGLGAKAEEPPQETPVAALSSPKKCNGHHKGRRPLPAELPRERIEHHPPKEQLVCLGCGQPKGIIGQEITEQLDYVPASFVVRYPTMSLGDIKALPVEEIADKDCGLFLWATMPKLEQAYEVIRAWGFTYTTTTFVWVKTNSKSGGIYSGLGHWTNGNAELVLFGKRGRPKRVAKNVKQIVMAPRGKHSAKPDEVRDRIVRLMGDVSRIELFARREYPGWTCLGNEIDGRDIRDALKGLVEGN